MMRQQLVPSRYREGSQAGLRPEQRPGQQPRGTAISPIDGYVHPDFSRVATVFRHQIRRTSGGAAVAVYHRGELVVDLWGGYRTDDGDPWQRDTMAMCFSTTKGLTSTALHVLADRGLVGYDDLVADYWPEFARNGKERVTVRHLLTHSAGLHRIRSIIDRADRMLDWDHMVDALARATPAYQHGERLPRADLRMARRRGGAACVGATAR